MDLPKAKSESSNNSKTPVLRFPNTSEKTTNSAPTRRIKGKTVIALILIALLGVSLPLFIIWNNNMKFEQEARKQSISVVTSNEDIKRALVKEFVYAATGQSDYYSPTLDSTFSVDRSQVSVSENSRSVSLYANAYRDLYTELFFISTEKKPSDYIKQEYGALPKYTQSAVTEKEGYSHFTFSFENTLFNQKANTTPVYYTVYYVKNDKNSKYVVLKVSSRVEKEVPQSAESLFTKTLLSVTINPTNVAADIVAEIPDMGAQVKFNKKRWSVSSQSSNNLSLSMVESSNKEPDVYANFSSVYYKNDRKDAVLEEALKAEIDSASKYYEKLKVITEKKETKVGAQSALMASFSYNSSTETIVRNYYVGWLPNARGYFTINVSKYLGKTDVATTNDTDIEELLRNVTFTTIQASSTTEVSPNVLGDTSLQVDAPAIIGKLGTVHIATTMCAQLSINDPTVIPATSAMKFKEICGSGTGSGFFVTEDGHIVTNSHVVANSPFYIMEKLFINDDSPILALIATELAARIQATKPDYFNTKEAVAQFKADVKVYILDLIGQKKITFTNVKSTSYIETGTPFAFDSNTGKLTNLSAYKELTLLNSNTLVSPLEHYGKLVTEKKSLTDNPFTYNVPDVAVLKVTTPNTKYPTLSLANYNLVTEGSKLFVIGFPAVAEGKGLYSTSSTMSATITTGTVSAIKSSVNNTFKLIQTDAGINPGNSGGPIIDNEAHAIAISTYSQSSVTAGNYNSGVSIEEASKMLSSSGIAPAEGTLSKNLRSGIDNLKKGYYQWAVRDLDLVINAYTPANDLLQPFKLLAQEKITSGQDNTPIAQIAGYYIHKTELPYIFAGLGVLLVIAIVLLMSLLRKPKKAESLVTSLPQTVSAPTAPPFLGQQTTIPQVASVPTVQTAVTNSSKATPMHELVNNIPQQAVPSQAMPEFMPAEVLPQTPSQPAQSQQYMSENSQTAIPVQPIIPPVIPQTTYSVPEQIQPTIAQPISGQSIAPSSTQAPPTSTTIPSNFTPPM